MKSYLLVGLIFMIFSCAEKQRQLNKYTDPLADTNKSDNADYKVSNDCQSWLTDSVLLTGDFVRYIKDDGKIKIEWGNKTFTRTLKHDYGCSAAPSWIPIIEWTTESYIGLDYGCGSPCWGTIILPLNLTDSVVERMYDFDRDIDRNLIVYLGTEDYNVLTIENWKTGKKQEIDAKIICEPAFFGYCIDSLKLNKDRLFVQWINGDEKKIRADNIELQL